MVISNAKFAMFRENAISSLLPRDLTGSPLSSPVTIGEHIDFVFEFDSPGGNWLFKCDGEIVRIEDRNGKVGLAVKVHDSVMGSA